MNPEASVYDKNDYYQRDLGGSRLSPAFNRLITALECWKVKRVARLMNLPVNAHVLDVGAGDGTTLSIFRSLGYQVTGTSASEISRHRAKHVFDLDLISDLNLETLPEKTFDLITYWHVYEHLENPEAHIAGWPRLLKSDGRLLIEVPHIGSLGANLRYSAWLGSDEKHHINHRRRVEIEDALDRAGLRATRWEYFSIKFSYVFLWSALLGVLFPGYRFDDLMEALQRPWARFRAKPVSTANLFASLFYLFPAVVAGLVWERLCGTGEILRVYARKR